MCAGCSWTADAHHADAFKIDKSGQTAWADGSRTAWAHGSQTRHSEPLDPELFFVHSILPFSAKPKVATASHAYSFVALTSPASGVA
mmetsp:Transcript_14624/g.29269  ORF Transcript_14624/g.29269 Transcript_14624/m.29269 type:complete len:87 (-) Transcript_14624:436-696(-)